MVPSRPKIYESIIFNHQLCLFIKSSQADCKIFKYVHLKLFANFFTNICPYINSLPSIHCKCMIFNTTIHNVLVGYLTGWYCCHSLTGWLVQQVNMVQSLSLNINTLHNVLLVNALAFKFKICFCANAHS